MGTRAAQVNGGYQTFLLDSRQSDVAGFCLLSDRDRRLDGIAIHEPSVDKFRADKAGNAAGNV
jgi:hypothetical protein